MNYFQKANDFYNAQDYQNAIDMYTKSAEFKENEAASLYNSAVCFIKLKKYTEAIIRLKSAIKIKRDSKYFFNLGYSYALLKDNKKALVYFNSAWALNHEDTDCEKAINLIIKNHLTKS